MLAPRTTARLQTANIVACALLVAVASGLLSACAIRRTCSPRSQPERPRFPTHCRLLPPPPPPRPPRAVPPKTVCAIETTGDEKIQWGVYEQQIERPIGDCLKRAGLVEKVLYIVTTMGVPLKVDGPGARDLAEHASVDSELALLYGKLKGQRYPRTGGVRNPFFMRRDSAFQHPAFPIYLVTRLAAYDLADVQSMIDRSLEARNRGKFVIDLQSEKDEPGNDWLRTAAMLLPARRVVRGQSL